MGTAKSLADVERAPLGQSLTNNIIDTITQLINEAENIDVLDINLHKGDYWWSTRLFLLSALAVDYTSIRCFAFVSDNLFIGLATPM